MRTRFLQKVGGDRFAGKVVKALAETFYEQSHYERGIEAYELLLKLDPTSREAGDWVLQIASGLLHDRGLRSRLRTTYERALSGYTAGGSWSRTQADPGQRRGDDARRSRSSSGSHALALHGKAQHDKTSRAEFEAAAVASTRRTCRGSRASRRRSRSSTTRRRSTSTTSAR